MDFDFDNDLGVLAGQSRKKAASSSSSFRRQVSRRPDGDAPSSQSSSRANSNSQLSQDRTAAQIIQHQKERAKAKSRVLGRDGEGDQSSVASTVVSRDVSSTSSVESSPPLSPATHSTSVASSAASSRSIRPRLVVRGASASACAAQDSGSYQMLYDECTYLCSIILTKCNKSIPKTLDAAADLAIMLSSRKSRSILWQGGGQGAGDHDDFQSGPSTPFTSRGGLSNSGTSPKTPVSRLRAKTLPVPKIWKSILEVVAALSQMASSGSGGNVTGTVVAADSTRGSPSKARTKSARRKEREFLGNTGSTGIMNGSGVAVAPGTAPTGPFHTTPELKQVVACLIYILSFDCTMSQDRSVSTIGSFKSPSVARRIRLAILEHGAALSGIGGLLIPTPGGRSQFSPRGQRLASSQKKILPPVVLEESSDGVVAPSSPLSQRSSTSDSQRRHALAPKGDPTAIGRRKRKKRRLLGLAGPQAPSSISMPSIPEQSFKGSNSDALEDGFDLDDDSKTMPPPPRPYGKSSETRTEVDELSFPSTTSFDADARNLVWTGKRKALSSSSAVDCMDLDDVSVGSMGSVSTTMISTHVAKKLASLRSKIRFDATETEICAQRGLSGEETLDAEFIAIGFPEGEDPWVSLVCLESLKRILSGAENERQSCLESEADADDSEEPDMEDESSNPLLVTNRLIGKSGVVPILGKAMSQSMEAATKLVFTDSFSHKNGNIDKEGLLYCQVRLSLLANIIDDTCFASDHNREGFCEEDPFSFEENNDGVIFHILIFLHHCCQTQQGLANEKAGEYMSLALRTLTSLTHENPLVVQQMVKCYEGSILSNTNGVRILSKLVYALEEMPRSNRASFVVTDHDMHRYDCTIFCLNTLANIIEGAGVRRMLTEMVVQDLNGRSIVWLKWLCRWLVQQTESFRHELMSIGGGKKRSTRRKKKVVSSQDSNDARSQESSASSSQDNSGEFQQHEEGKLVAAGNGCVVLAFLMTEPENDNSDLTVTSRNLIIDELPLDEEGNSMGVTMVINTLKAFCNFLSIKLGGLSLAIIPAVQKLIKGLEQFEAELEQEDATNEDADDPNGKAAVNVVEIEGDSEDQQEKYQATDSTKKSPRKTSLSIKHEDQGNAHDTFVFP